METIVEQSSAIGRAKTVLVFGDGAKSRAVITALVAQSTGAKAKPRLRFKGPVRFSPETAKHIEAVVLPVFDRICDLLGLKPEGFDVSGVNLGAASSQDIGIDISGFSADLPLFLALLSARLRIPLPQDVLCTGHIASLDGDVRLVRNLPLKLDAARADRFIRRFFHPALNADESVAGLTPAEHARVRDAFATKAGGLRTIAVGDVAEALPLLVPEEAVISAALTGSYLGCRIAKSAGGSPLLSAARFLGANTNQRYFDVLKSKLVAGEAEAATCLLENWASFWTGTHRYPSGFGKRLRRLILSVPPSVRLRDLKHPLLSIGSCIKLSQCASGTDFDDVIDLYWCVSGGVAEVSWLTRSQRNRSKSRPSFKSTTLAIVLAEISQEHLAAAVCLPIDAARASFVLDSVMVGSSTQAYEVITSFYIHLLQFTCRTTGNLTFDQAGPDALDLLERTFTRNGGSTAAIAEATTGVQGGLRFVLDRMTEQFKRDCLEKHVMHVLATAIDPLDWPARVRFIREFFQRCPDIVPREFRTESPARFARNYEPIVRAYVHGMDEVKQLLRSL